MDIRNKKSQKNVNEITKIGEKIFIKKKILNIFLIIVAVFISSIVCLNVGFFAGKSSAEEKLAKVNPLSTAKEAYNVAFVSSRNWSKDAELQRITSKVSKVDKDGKASGWDIIFYSASKDMSYKVYVKDGELRTEEEIKNIEKVTLKGDFIDSKEVYEKVKTVIGKEDFKIKSIDLSFDSNAKKWLWTVSYDKGGITIDAEK